MWERGEWMNRVLTLSALALALRFVLLPLVPSLLTVSLPFLIALIPASLAQAPARRISRALGLPVGACALLLTAILLGGLGVGLGLLVRLAGRELAALLARLSSGEGEMLLRLGLKGETAELVKDTLYAALASLGASLGRLILALPSALIMALTALAASFYLALLLPRAEEHTPAWLRRLWQTVRPRMARLGKTLCRAYGLLFLVTFLISLVGLSLLRVGFPLLAALGIAAVDLLPVLGTGAVLIPWSLLSLATGKQLLALCLALLWLLLTAVRQVLEPRLVGTHLGLSPITALFSMYAGLHLLGAAGILLGPLAASALTALLRGDG